MAKTRIPSQDHGKAIRRKMERGERIKSGNMIKKKVFVRKENPIRGRKPNQGPNQGPRKPRHTAKISKKSKPAKEGAKDDVNGETVDQNTQNEEIKGEESETRRQKKKFDEEKKKFDFEKNSRTVFVGNLPNNLDHKDVAKLFKDCGLVESARIRSIVPEKEKLSQKVAIITKRLHPKVNSFNAYVVFKDNEKDECVKKALAMNGKIIDGHHIRVDRSQRPKAKKETLTSRKKSVFVGNLRFDLRDDELINHFKKVGTVSYVRLVRDSTTGLGKGFGFVVFEERAMVKKALELDNTQFKGRALRVKKVQE